MQTDFNKKIGQDIEANRGLLAEAITNRRYRTNPESAAGSVFAGRSDYLQDTNYHLAYLSEAISIARPALFVDYVAWAKSVRAGLGVKEKELTDDLQAMRESLEDYLPPEESAVACEYLDAGIEQVKESVTDYPSLLKTDNPLGDLAENYLNALLHGERYAASRLILDAVESGTKIKDLYLFVFQPVQHEIGRLWQMNELSVAQEHYCTAATQMIISQLYPHIFTPEKNGQTIIATCVSGDLHEIGARMVADFFEMDGWNTFYLGANVPVPSVIQSIIEHRADLILISATMTFHVRAVRELITAIRASEAAKSVKIMVGGYPFNVAPDLWKEIGADAYSRDALSAVAVADELMNQTKR